MGTRGDLTDAALEDQAGTGSRVPPKRRETARVLGAGRCALRRREIGPQAISGSFRNRVASVMVLISLLSSKSIRHEVR